MSRVYTCIATLTVVTFASHVLGQVPIVLREACPPGNQYRISARVELTGQLTLPAEEKNSAPAVLTVTGRSAIDYDERILPPGGAEKTEQRSLRVYRQIDFSRKLGDKDQQGTLRPAVRRLVVLRLNHREVPFSQDGPLTWGEIDLIRTDVYTPALAGLLPTQPVKPGDHWRASLSAIEELTDMERLEEGGIDCRLDAVAVENGRRLARIKFTGNVRGVNENGPTRQQLDGTITFDLTSNSISGMKLHGVHLLLDEKGKATGKIEGKFTLSRQAGVSVPELADPAIRGLALEPTPDNTQLLFDDPAVGLRFLYPRKWRVAGVRGRQVTLDEPGGNGLLLTVEPAGKIPTAVEYLTENQNFLKTQQAVIMHTDPPKRFQAGPPEIEQCGLDVELAGQPLRMDYYISRQNAGGVLAAARLLPKDLATTRSEVERIIKSISTTAGGQLPVPVSPPGK